MENIIPDHLSKEESHEAIPSLIQAISAREVSDFDNVRENYEVKNQHRPTRFRPPNISIFGIEASAAMAGGSEPLTSLKSPSAFFSVPPSPIEDHTNLTSEIQNFNNTQKIVNSREAKFYSQPMGLPKPPPSPVSFSVPPSPIEDRKNFLHEIRNFDKAHKNAKFYSQPMPKGFVIDDVVASAKYPNVPLRNPRVDKLRDNRFDSFKTWSGKLERQISNLRGKRRENDEESQVNERPAEMETLTVDRYFDALEGPELDTLKASEEIILPEDKQWPFLLRFPVSSFGICLGVSSQAIMWKSLSSSNSMKFLHITPEINLVLWFISVALITIVSTIYTLKIIFYFEAVRREYYHPIRVNFFFAPFIALLFLAIGVPTSVTKKLHESLWYVLMSPFLCLELKIYGQWMSGGQRRLSKVANPSNHLSVVGNFVGALLGASMGLKEGPIFFFAVGMAHYIVLFVTLYQRLPTNETLPKELHPVFFLFVAAPSVASMAWDKIQGEFDYGCRITYFIAMFLYFSLAVRVNFFRGIRFSLAWWAYTFPMTGAAIATIRYSNVVANDLTKILTVILCVIATLTVASLLVTTIIHAFVLGNLFPNDIAIAISDRRPKTSRKWYHRRSGSADAIIEQYLKYTNSDDKDIEACNINPTSLKGVQSI